MMDNTARLSMPYIIASQAQKEVTHNMALNILDLFVQPVVEAMDLVAPLVDPQEGQAWVVGVGASGDWEGQDDNLALWSGGAWSYHRPVEGMSFWVRETGLLTIFQSGMWQTGVLKGVLTDVEGHQVVGERQPQVADVSGGQVIDSEARMAINSLLSACRNHGLIES